MFCHECGGGNPENAKFCNVCGKSLADSSQFLAQPEPDVVIRQFPIQGTESGDVVRDRDPSSADPEESSSILKYLLATITIAGIVVGGYWILHEYSSSSSTDLQRQVLPAMTPRDVNNEEIEITNLDQVRPEHNGRYRIEVDIIRKKKVDRVVDEGNTDQLDLTVKGRYYYVLEVKNKKGEVFDISLEHDNLDDPNGHPGLLTQSIGLNEGSHCMLHLRYFWNGGLPPFFRLDETAMYQEQLK